MSTRVSVPVTVMVHAVFKENLSREAAIERFDTDLESAIDCSASPEVLTYLHSMAGPYAWLYDAADWETDSE